MWFPKNYCWVRLAIGSILNRNCKRMTHEDRTFKLYLSEYVFNEVKLFKSCQHLTLIYQNTIRMTVRLDIEIKLTFTNAWEAMGIISKSVRENFMPNTGILSPTRDTHTHIHTQLFQLLEVDSSNAACFFVFLS